MLPNAYREDLAFIHDAGFGAYAAAAGPVLLAALRSAGIERGRVVDLGCGSGILAEKVAGAGYDVVGIDISSAMVKLARHRVPSAEFRVGSLLSAELPTCVAVAIVGECCNYLFDRANSKAALAKLLRRVYQALVPGGLFMLDVAEPGRVPGGGPRKSFVEGDGWAVLVTAEEDRAKRTLTREITSFRQVGALYRRDVEIHRLRLIPRAELAAQLRAAGFRVRVLNGYNSFEFPPGYVGFLARKPA